MAVLGLLGEDPFHVVVTWARGLQLDRPAALAGRGSVHRDQPCGRLGGVSACVGKLSAARNLDTAVCGPISSPKCQPPNMLCV